MPCHASAASWNAGTHRCRPPGRGLEIAAIILGFFFFWPAWAGSDRLFSLDAYGLSAPNAPEDLLREELHSAVGELPAAPAFLIDWELRVRGISPPRTRAPRGRASPPRRRSPRLRRIRRGTQ